MHRARRVWLFMLALGSVTLIAKTETDDQWKRLVALRAPIKRVGVLSGSDLQIDGIRCRLFGIRLPEDPKVRALAKRFLALYMKDSGGYFYVYNVTAPI